MTDDSLKTAQYLLNNAAEAGFEWPNADEAFKKVEEEILEFKVAHTRNDKQEEFGDILIALINYARMSGIDADQALRQANHKFEKRFQGMLKDNPDFKKLSLDEMLKAWKKQK